MDNENKALINFCTMGHVDHGKTTFMSALTIVAYERSAGEEKVEPKKYQEIDNAPEEKLRGITINASAVNFLYSHNGVVYNFCGTDCPGHEDYVKNAIVGAFNNDGVILLISAAEGVMPQTKEHVMLAKQLGIQKIIVVVNKCDKVLDAEMLDIVEMTIKELLAEYNFVDVPIMRCSALPATEGNEKEKDNVEKILIKMCEYFKPEKRDLAGPFLLSIESVFTKTGRGTIVTGKVVRGVCKIGDEVEVIGFNPKAKKFTVIGLEIFRKAKEQISAGDNVGVLLRGVQRDEVCRGQMLAKPGSIVAHDTFKIQTLVLKPEENGRKTGFSETYSPQIFSGTANVTCNLKFPKDIEFVNPGDNVLLTVKVLSPIAVEAGMSVTFREGNKTIASGKITEIVN